MKPVIRTHILAGVLAVGGVLAFGSSTAKAQGYGYGGYGGGQGGGYGQGYGQGGGYGQGYGQGGGVPSYNYYGNGGHDLAPHMHNVQVPFGGFSYYGNGAHDLRPHAHTETPYGVTSYNGGFFSNTQSYSPPSPYTYMPW